VLIFPFFLLICSTVLLQMTPRPINVRKMKMNIEKATRTDEEESDCEENDDNEKKEK
jgi:hypothetical protein